MSLMKVYDMNDIIKIVEESYELKIVNKSFNDVPLFDLSMKQPFNFYITITYSSIRGKSGFELHFPSLTIDGNDIDEFVAEVNKVKDIVNILNSGLKNNYTNEWVLQ